MEWIKNNPQRKRIPKELYYDDYQTDRDEFGNTPLMLWIQWHKGIDIPKKLYYKGYQTDKNVED